jgi:hypothetical protein
MFPILLELALQVVSMKMIRADNHDRHHKSSPKTSKETPQHHNDHYNEMDTDSALYHRCRLNFWLNLVARAREAKPFNEDMARISLNCAWLAYNQYLKKMDEEEREEQEQARIALVEAEKARRLQAVSDPTFVYFWLAYSQSGMIKRLTASSIGTLLVPSDATAHFGAPSTARSCKVVAVRSAHTSREIWVRA